MPEGKLKKRIIAAVCSAVFLCGCGGDIEAPTEYTVISGGTEAVITMDSAAAGSSENTQKENADEETELYIPEKMVTRYASLDFDKRMQDAYDDVVETMTEFRTKTYIPLTISTLEYVKVLETVRCEQMMFFYLEKRESKDFDPQENAIEMSFTYKYSVSEVNRMLREAEAAAKEIVAQTEGMSDYEKLKFFHDYLVINVESNVNDPLADSIYGALVNKRALCEGYAKAFSYLCNLSDIENMIVTGYTDVDHMWNMVMLDGNWYHIDVGWDKPAEVLSEQYPDMVLYQYFMADDSIMENNRVISTMLCNPPKAESMDYNFFVKEGLYASSYEEALEIIERSCARSIDAGEKYFMLKLDSSNLCVQMTTDLIRPDGSGVSDIDRIMQKLNFYGRVSYIDYYNSYRVIIFVLE